jgi:DNA-binding PadR family transcriptional regulator
MNDSAPRKREGAALRSPLAWGVLGLVIEQPSHGYELAQRFDRIYGDTLVLSSRMNIYRLLDSLRGHALIEEMPAPAKAAGEPASAPRARPPRPTPHYRATGEGVRAYQRWMVSQMEEERRRQRLFATQLAMLEPDSALSVIERYEQECLQEARDAEELAESAAESPGSQGVARRLSDADERLALQVRLTWIAFARSELKKLIRERSTARAGHAR